MSDLQNTTSEDKLRMYGLTPYNMSSIQKAIQFGHAVVEYSLLHDSHISYVSWAERNKTFIILNGGTTNKTGGRLGTMNMHLEVLEDEMPDWPVATFYEPDLGDQLTAVVFLVPEQVYNKKKFPDWLDVVKLFPECETFSYIELGLHAQALKNEDHELYQAWVINTGGKKNVMMREFIKPFKLAT